MLKLSDDFICIEGYIYNVSFHRFFVDENASSLKSTKVRTHVLHWCLEQDI